jgi:hypothetical protein
MKHYHKVISVLALLCGFVFITSTSVLAASAELTIDSDQIGVGEAVQLSVAINGASSAAHPKINAPDGISIQSAGSSNQFQFINGTFSSQLSYNYSVVGLKPGRYTLGPIEIKAGNKTLRTNSVVLTVTSSASPQGNSVSPAGQGRTDTDQRATGSSPLSLILNVPKTTIYQGEIVPITIKLLSGRVSLNEVTYPNLSQSDFVFGQMEKPLETEEIIQGEAYKVVEFHTTLTPVKTGSIFLGPVSLNCNIIVKTQDSDGMFDDFFPNYQKQSVQVKSKRVLLHILPLPVAGKPANFSGGIGQFQLKVAATPETVNQGDPVTVKLDISGKGNFQAVNAPVLQNPSGFKVYDPQRKNGAEQKEDISFEQILIPVDAKIRQIGPYIFSYFNPVAGKYQQIVTPAIPLSVKVTQGYNESSSGVENSDHSEHFGRDLVFIKDSPGKLRLVKERLYYQSWFWLIQLIPLIGLLVALFYCRYRKLLASDNPAARSIRAGSFARKQLEKANQSLSAGKSEELLEELHQIIRNYLAQKYNLNAAGMTGDVTDILRNQGVTETILQKIKDFFAQYDFYRFTGAAIPKNDAEQMWADINWIIENLNHSTSQTILNNGCASPAVDWKGARNQ